MKKIKVINVITRLIVGGAQETVIETCMLLQKARFDSSIISGPQTGLEGELISRVQQHNIPLTILPQLVRAINPLKDIIVLYKLMKIFKAEKPDIVHTHSSKAGILGRWAARLAGVPIIVHTIHGWGYHSYQHSFIQRFFLFAERITAGITEKLIAVSYKNVEKGLKDKIGCKQQYVTIHSCINLADFLDRSGDQLMIKKELGLPFKDFIVGTVGRLSEQKNPLDFVRVAAEVIKTIPETSFIFIGDGPLRTETEKFIGKLNLSHKIILTGIKNDIRALLGCMDVFIMTSLWEGLPRTIPQAMAAGLPVVANSVDGICEIIEDGINGFLIQPHDISVMADRIIRLLRDRELRAELGAEGCEKAVREFSLGDMVKRIASLYEDLLKRKSVRI